MDLNKSFTCLKLLTSCPTSPERKSKDILGLNELILHLSHKRLSHGLFRAFHLILLHKMDHLSWAIQWHLVHLWCGATITTIQFRSIFTTVKGKRLHIKQSFPVALPPPTPTPAPSPRQPPLCFPLLWIYPFWTFHIFGIIVWNHSTWPSIT